MGDRDRIKELAFLVGDNLERYVQIHNHIQQESASMKSVFKNLFGRGVSNEVLLSNAEALVPVWVGICDQVAEYRRSSAPMLTSDENRYVLLLSRYADALKVTVGALVERQRLLLEHKKGTTHVTLAMFNEAAARYEEAIHTYTALGQALNSAAPVIFD